MIKNMRSRCPFISPTPGPQDQSRRGFTFFEVMTTVVILGIGIVFIYRAFLTCLTYQNYLTTRLYAMQFLDNKLAELQRDYQRSQEAPPLFTADPFPVEINNQGLIFQLDSNYEPVPASETLLKLNVVLSWRQSGRDYQLKRSVYILLEEKDRPS